jgi:hypothetical protein
MRSKSKTELTPPVHQDTPYRGEDKSDTPYRGEIEAMLMAGASIKRVCQILHLKHGIDVPVSQVEAAALSVQPLSPTRLSTRLHGADLEIDVIGEMARLLKLQEQRLSTLILVEEVVADRAQGLDPRLDMALEMYWKMLGQYMHARQALGELPSEPLKIQAIAITPNLPTIQELIDAPDTPDAPTRIEELYGVDGQG